VINKEQTKINAGTVKYHSIWLWLWHWKLYWW